MCFNKRLTLLTLKSSAGRREPEVAESSVVWADVSEPGTVTKFQGLAAGVDISLTAVMWRREYKDYTHAEYGGDIEAVIRGFKQGDHEFLFGESKTAEGTSISAADDIVPYNCTAYMTVRPDGKVNLYKFPKVKFMPQGEDSKQQEGSKIEYGTAQLKGTYSPLLSNHHDCYKRLGVDPDSDSEFIEKWFTTAGFYTAGTDADSTDGG